jgi:hypothetical protein
LSDQGTVTDAGAPQWSPAGRYLAFANSAQDIVALSSDGAEALTLSDDLAPEWWPTWSPDGAEVAFTVGTPPATAYVVGVDGTNRRPMNGPPVYTGQLYWSPDGTRAIGYADCLTADTCDSVVILGVAPGVESATIAAPGNFSNGSWQPRPVPIEVGDPVSSVVSSD